MVLQLLIMAGALGASSFGVGMLPLSYSFSKKHLERLSVLGTGLLLGAALGVIIPEGIEAAAHGLKEVPTQRIASCLITGFVLMLVIEQLVAPNAHSHSIEVEFDAELTDLETSQANGSHKAPSSSGENRQRAFALLLGLVIHGAADGIALGVANVQQDGISSALSFIVFLALILHKAPTSLAFTTSLLATSLPRPECKKYVAIFSSSTPLAAIFSYLVFTAFGGEQDGLAGMALLVSGGSFLYVATVLQPVSHHSPAPGDIMPSARVVLITIGMLVPLILSSLFEHSH
ncbi:ZIP-like iron-zinc transporter [Crepidotus variabilis]|uniref:ZIP-like iron-zinc transporter n=1 Tax=Crepidotus variabilis TaxID=179855 RepID=A0A9P6JTG5_9AGAR|nr:ZIP-like iron-zinc transporter [Crepidotus variabilis]